jgi:hypothetical protein
MVKNIIPLPQIVAATLYLCDKDMYLWWRCCSICCSVYLWLIYSRALPFSSSITSSAPAAQSAKRVINQTKNKIAEQAILDQMDCQQCAQCISKLYSNPL